MTVRAQVQGILRGSKGGAFAPEAKEVALKELVAGEGFEPSTFGL